MNRAPFQSEAARQQLRYTTLLSWHLQRHVSDSLQRVPGAAAGSRSGTQDSSVVQLGEPGQQLAPHFLALEGFCCSKNRDASHAFGAVHGSSGSLQGWIQREVVKDLSFNHRHVRLSSTLAKNLIGLAPYRIACVSIKQDAVKDARWLRFPFGEARRVHYAV